MNCEVNPVYPSIHAPVTWLLGLILIARGPVEVITGPFTNPESVCHHSVPASRAFVS